MPQPKESVMRATSDRLNGKAKRTEGDYSKMPKEDFGKYAQECWKANLATVSNPDEFLSKNAFHFATLCRHYDIYRKNLALCDGEGGNSGKAAMLRFASLWYDRFDNLAVKLGLLRRPRWVDLDNQGEDEGPESEFLT